jgi:hypothetical protein
VTDGPIPDFRPLPGVQRAYAPDPQDRLSGFTIAWAGFALYFAVVEGVALWQDAKHDDRTKRTLSSNLRWLAATDSVTGVPLAVPHGKLRRLALSIALGPGWLPTHLGREGVV